MRRVELPRFFARIGRKIGAAMGLPAPAEMTGRSLFA